MNISYKVLVMCATFITTQLAYAQTDHSGHQMDHSQHQTKPTYSAPAPKGELSVLPKMPASGEARETGSDGRNLMEPTSASDNLAQQCAKGSRALVMLDNRTWAKCGGKPEGAAQGPEDKQAVDHSQHQMH